MKGLIGFVFLFASQYSWAFLESCGNHTYELKYKSLNWEKVYSVNLTSSIGNQHSVICAGFDATGVKHLIYREEDETNAKVADKIENLFKNHTILSAEMLKPVQQRLIRSGVLVIFKLSKSNISNGIHRLEMTTRFLRNLGKGFGGNDYREMVIQSDFSLNTKRFTNRLKDSQTNFTFDQADLKLKVFPIKISEIYFNLDGTEVESFNTKVLPEVDKIL